MEGTSNNKEQNPKGIVTEHGMYMKNTTLETWEFYPDLLPGKAFSNEESWLAYHAMFPEDTLIGRIVANEEARKKK